MKPNEAKIEREKIRHAYRLLFKGSDAEAVLKDLNKTFNRSSLKKINGVLDPNAIIAAAGSRDVLLHIENMMRDDNATS